VNGRGEAFEALGVRNGWGRGRVPLELVWRCRGAAHQLQNRDVARGKALAQGGSEHSGSAGEKYPGGLGWWVGGSDLAFLLMNTIAGAGETWFCRK
jgi:hypothetical protein